MYSPIVQLLLNHSTHFQPLTLGFTCQLRFREPFKVIPEMRPMSEETTCSDQLKDSIFSSFFGILNDFVNRIYKGSLEDLEVIRGQKVLI